MLTEVVVQSNKVRRPETSPSPQAGEKNKAQSTLIFSVLDGLGYSVMVGAGETYFIPYAVFLGGSNLLLGLFVALPIFVGSLRQIFSERLLLAFGTRKRLICAGVSAQALIF